MIGNRETSMDYDDLKRQPVTRLGSTATILIGLGLMLVGYFLLFVIGGSSLRLGEASEQWPTVDGVVISSGLAGGAFRGEDDRSYTPEITYRYELEGDTYKSDRINFRVGGFNLPSRSAFREYIDKYPEGERISVYYDPKNPE
ncbi:MAG TPA: hypothetical protein DD473_11420, partial [Planctomycetaceae bacterium]|nr:hypothetical protein [Planctomycetaceae bacterium]